MIRARVTPKSRGQALHLTLFILLHSSAHRCIAYPKSFIEEPADPEFSRAAKAAWARLIQKVYEVDPMRCLRCGTEMRVLALIEDELVIEKILKHLHLWDPCTQSQALPAEDIDWPSNSQLPMTYAPLPNIT